ncbi:hypothetical protein [Candidatus Thiodubiliella endoseptemdiera]|uniref:hypothetical protein n=1 Tax=Candidatus Thiodubiliella endoseptemdiera TaxID=2738886 RepID=UPI0034DFD376
MNCDDLKNGFKLIDKVDFFVQTNTGNWEQDRKNIRDSVIELFKSEEVGTGRGEKSVRVIYCVEKTHNNEIVYLQRPAYLNKGFDFTVNVKTYKFKAPTEKNPKRETKTPRHDSVYLELQAINKKDKKLMGEAIKKIYNCEDPRKILKDKKFAPLKNGYIGNVEYETLLKTIKWLFIEQDITYWSFSGRAMFKNGIDENVQF